MHAEPWPTPASSRRPIRIGAFLIDPNRNIIAGSQVEVHAEPKIVELLMALAARPGEVLSRDALIETVWNGAYGADQSLSWAMSRLRKILNDKDGADRIIETIPKRGYRLVAKVGPADAIAPPRNPPPIKPALHKILKLASGLVALAAVVAAGLLLAWSPDPPSPGVAPAVKRLAVLPLRSLSDDPDDEYFADGLSEELINNLTRLPRLAVAGRTSSFYFKGSKARLGEIATALGVDYALEGSVWRKGERLRVTARLVDAATGLVLWSDSFDRPTADIFTVQDEIAGNVADQLDLRLGGDVARRWTVDTKAYEAYLTGLAHSRLDERVLRRPYVDHVHTALRHFKDAVDRDPNFAPAHARLALTYLYLDFSAPTVGIATPFSPVIGHDEAIAAARRHIEQALRLAPDLADAHLANGLLIEKAANRAISFDSSGVFAQATAAYQRAFALDSGLYEALLQLVELEFGQGHGERVMSLLVQARRIEPLAPLVLFLTAINLIEQNRLPEARVVLDRLLALYPDFAEAKFALGWLEWTSGRLDAAIGQFEGLLTEPYLRSSSFELGMLYLELGDKERALAYLATASGEDWRWQKAVYERDYESFHAAVEQKLRADPDNQALLYLASSAAWWAGRHDKLMDYLRRLNPDIETYNGPVTAELLNAAFLQHAARAFEVAGDAERAARFRQAVLDYSERQTAFTNWYGRIWKVRSLAVRGRKEEAIAALREAASQTGPRKLYNPFWWGWGPHIADHVELGPLLKEPEFTAIIAGIEQDHAAILARLRDAEGSPQP